MPQTIRDVMTTDLVTLPPSTTLVDAAKAMVDRSIGDVLVADNGEIRGVVTDRDIVVRGVAEGCDNTTTTLEDVCSADLLAVAPSDSVEDAARVMADNAIRRLPVVDNGQAVGIVSIGDLAIAREPDSALGDISSAPPNT